jgi:hypothetical protein
MNGRRILVCLNALALTTTLAFLVIAGSAGAQPSRAATECVVDYTGNGTWGPLSPGSTHGLASASINESDWGGSLSYHAYRWTGQTLTYDALVSSGAWTYGTSGNVTRSTSIYAPTSNGGAMSTWYVQEQTNAC